LQRQVQAGTIVLDGSFVRLPGHQVRLGEGEEEMWRAIAPHLAGEQRFRPPRVRDLAALLHDPEAKVRRLLKLCGRLGRVDEIAQDHFFARDTTAEMIAILREAAARSPDGSFTAADIRDLMSNGRKVAIQILEFFDRHGVTRRSGDRRRINPQGQDLFAGGGS
jgi:selenocysteine-specific elongation factor